MIGKGTEEGRWLFFFAQSVAGWCARGLGFGMSLSAYVRAWAGGCESGCGCVRVCACLQHRVQVERFEANWDLSRSSSSKRGWGEQAADY